MPDTITGGKEAIQKGSMGIEFIVSEKNYLEYLSNMFAETKKETSEKASEWNATEAAYKRKQISYLPESALADAEGNERVINSAVVKDKTKTKISLMLANKPSPIPLPVINENYNQPLDKTGKMDNQEALSVLWNALFEDYRERHKMISLYARMMLDNEICGIGLCEVYEAYDCTIGENDIFVGYVNPRDIHFVCDDTDIRKSRVIFHEKWYYPYELKVDYRRKFNEVMNAISDSDVQYNYMSDYERDKRHKGKVRVVHCYTKDLTHRIAYINLETGEEITDEQAIEIEQRAILDGSQLPSIEERPIYKYPNGRLSIFLDAGEKSVMLYDGENTFVGGVPYFAFVGSPYGDSCYGEAEADDLTSIQNSTDYLMQHMMVQVAAGAWFKYFVQEGSVKEPDKIIPGVQRIPVSKANSVISHQPQNLINDVVGAISVMDDRARSVSGMESAISGKAIPQARSGVAIRELKQSSSLKTQVSYDIFNSETLVELWKFIADYMLESVKKGRRLRVSSLKGAPTVIPEDLSKITASVDIQMDTDTSLEMNDAAKASIGLQLAQGGFRDDLNVPFIGLESLDRWLPMMGIREQVADYMRRRQMAEQSIQNQKAAQGNPSAGTGGNPETGNPAGMPDGAGMPEELMGAFGQ